MKAGALQDKIETKKTHHTNLIKYTNDNKHFFKSTTRFTLAKFRKTRPDKNWNGSSFYEKGTLCLHWLKLERATAAEI